MALIEVNGFSFAYPGSSEEEPALPPTTFSVEEGAFCVLTGATGSGKTTLLRAMKPELADVGQCKGGLSVCGHDLVRDGVRVDEIEPRESAGTIEFVMQDPGAQIVCDTVWHELAFGLENLGCEQNLMRRRVAEVAHFMGIEPWVRKGTEEISGGQKQLVNLAAVLAMRPRVLLLDEPTAQLDPHSRRLFMQMLGRVNRELGITVVMAAHDPEEAQGLATQTVALSETGPLARREDVAGKLLRSKARTAQETVSVRDAWFRYERADDWVLRGMDARGAAGVVHAVVGGNGCGKSTLLQVMAGIRKPQRGHVENPLRSAQALLPQDPKALFVCDSVAEELAEWRDRGGWSEQDEQAMLKRFGLMEAADRHPFDLSGGQQQKLALAKLLLRRPKLLLLDEPTKGLDPESAVQAARLIRSVADEGATVVLVTHDLDFAYILADYVTMLFDGQSACTQAASRFFEGNLIWRPSEESRLYGAL